MNHKHHDLIVAWAKGAKIQYLGIDIEGNKTVWMDCETAPNWYTCKEYRIKPNFEALSNEEYEELMKKWDYWRKQITDGDTSSAPRDWFESTIDYLIEKVSENYKPRELTDEEIYELEDNFLSIQWGAYGEDKFITGTCDFARALLKKAIVR
jgi:hypothetical protein